jgi:hypothetical protein
MTNKAKLIGVTTAVIIAVEIFLRVSGAVDFPTYNVDSEIGCFQRRERASFVG